MEDEPAPDSVKDALQTFVFSATLNKDLQRNLKKRTNLRKSRKTSKPLTTLGELSHNETCSVARIQTEDLLERLDFRDPEPEVIDISPEGGIVPSLQEGQMECLSADRVGRPCFSF